MAGKKSLSLIFYTFFVLTILANSIDTFGYAASFEKYFHLTSNTTLFIFITFFIVLRTKKEYHLSHIVRNICTLLFSILLFTTITLSIIDFFTPANYVYAATRLNIDQIGYLSLLFGLTLLINASDKFFNNNYKKFIFFSAPVIMGIGLLIRSWPFDYFFELVKEDRLVENTQFIVLFVASIFSLTCGIMYYKKREVFLTIFFALCSLCLFFVAGDEISWGQRIFDIATPENIKNINLQGEITFHNISLFNSYVTIGYVIIGFLGATAWILKPQLEKIIPKKYTKALIPPWYTASFFIFAFAFNLYFLIGEHNVGEWSEVAELMLYLGIGIWISEQYIKLSEEVKHSQEKAVKENTLTTHR